ncbi:ZW10 interactor-like isoform X2 [Elgaria multicarinata webbii]|uniref:ZW10 interactor-like isoform X2 n=1 Tax=Elgaria multicarinata webbii TaxID=159646 RepID=UPI002FCD1F96
MAAAAAAVELLALLKDVLTSEGQAKDGIEAELPAQVLAEHAVNTRKTHKLMYTQLQVVKFLLDFLDSAPCIQDASGAAVRKEMAEAKQQWKALKVEYQQQVEAIKGAVPQNREMEEKVRNAQDRCLKEQELLCERQQQLERHVTELQNRVEVHHEELQRLQAELEEQERQASVWKEEMQSISDFRCLLETLRGVKLTCATESDLEVELSSHSQPGTAASHQLKLRLHWENDGNITLQNASPFFPLPDVLPMGACSTIKAFILELQHSYAQQAQLLAEIELLQSCFAIDWQQEKRLVSYLKPSSTCCLYVEPGYPTSGRICLLSVKNQHGTVDVTSYKPPQERPSLKKWLVYLSAVDFSAAS